MTDDREQLVRSIVERLGEQRARTEAALARIGGRAGFAALMGTAPVVTAAAPAADVDHLPAMTPLGRDVLRARERTGAPAPISPTVRRGLAATRPGRQVLAERARRDPEGEAAANGLDP